MSWPKTHIPFDSGALGRCRLPWTLPVGRGLIVRRAYETKQAQEARDLARSMLWPVDRPARIDIDKHLDP